MSRRLLPLLLCLAPVAEAAELLHGRDVQGEAFELPVGAVLRVELYENASTGYQWIRRDGFREVLESVPCEARPAPPAPADAGPPMVGAGGISAYCFRALAPGRAYLHLAYARPWLDDAPVHEHFSPVITVVAAAP